MRIKILSLLYKITHALDARLFLLHELALLKRHFKVASRSFWMEVLRRPSETEDWINLLCFLDPEQDIILIDVGANKGEWFSRFVQFFPKTDVFAFEPTSKPFGIMKSKFGELKNVSLNKLALSNVNAKRQIFINQTDTYSSFETYEDDVEIAEGLSLESERIECRRLDEFSFGVSEKIVVLKVDVQGHELEVFEGAQEFLKTVSVCIVEVSFVNEFKNKEPSFLAIAEECGKADLYPVIFQDYGRKLSNYAYERDVIFVRRNLLNNIFHSNY